MSIQRRTPGNWRAWPVAVVALSVAGLYFAREVLIPISFAVTFSFLLTSPVSWFQRRGLSRVGAVVVTMILTLSAAVGTGWVVGTQLLSVVNDLPRYQLNIHNKLESIRIQQRGALGRAAESINAIQKEISIADTAVAPPAPAQGQTRGTGKQTAKAPTEVQVVQQQKNSFQFAYDFLQPALRILATLGIIMIFSIFMLIHREDLRNRMLRLVGISQMNVMTQAFDEATVRISKYLRMQFLLNGSFGALICVGLFVIGVPSAILWGVVAGVFRLVPFVGILIASSLPLALSLAVFDGWLNPLLVFLLFAVSEIVLANFIEPIVYGSHTGISALALLVATVFWAALWGPAGLVLSAPLTVCVVVLGRHVPQLSFLHILLGDEPVLKPEAQMFQRLLAMDQQEAKEVVDSFLKGKPLVELYDQVFVPALTLAEQDRHKGNLDEAREEFIFLSIEEMIAEFSNYSPEETSSTSVVPNVSVVPKREGRPGRIICFAANDHADEIAGAMLAQLLEQEGTSSMCFPANSSLDQLASMLDPGSDDMMCISSLPPFAFASARTLYKKLRRRFPKVKIAVGLWGFTGDPDKLKEHFERDQPDVILTSLAQALGHGVEARHELQVVRPAS